MTLKNQRFSIKRHKVNVLDTMGDIKRTKTRMLMCEDKPTNRENAWFSPVMDSFVKTSFWKPIKVCDLKLDGVPLLVKAVL